MDCTVRLFNASSVCGPASFIVLAGYNLLSYNHKLSDKLCVILDDGKYMNHSTNPNCSTDMSTGNTYAIRDIEPDEQLFEDYQNFEHPIFLLALLQKYKCAPDYYNIPAKIE